MPQGVAVRVRSAAPRRRKANFVSPWAFAQGLYSIACGSFFPQIFCCAKYLWEPCVFLPLGNGALVPSRSRSTDTPEGVPSVGLRTSSSRGGTTSGHGARCKGMSKAHPFRFYAGPLAQSILRSVTELPAQWAIPKFGRMPKPHRGCRQNIRPHPFFQKISAARIFFGSPTLSFAKRTL